MNCVYIANTQTGTRDTKDKTGKVLSTINWALFVLRYGTINNGVVTDSNREPIMQVPINDTSTPNTNSIDLGVGQIFSPADVLTVHNDGNNTNKVVIQWT